MPPDTAETARKNKTMNIKDIIAKLLKGETLTDAEKAFAEQYDAQKEIDTASAAARRKAEKEAKDALAKLDAQNAAMKELNDKLEAAEQALNDAKGGSTAEISKMQKQIAKLEAINTANEKKLAENARMDAIRAAVKQAGIAAADGISPAALDRLIDLAVGDTDTGDADAMKAVLDQFKADNPSMIAASVKTGSGLKGDPNASKFTGIANPWKADSFNLTKQIEIMNAEPNTAKTMMAEAGVASPEA
jgi:hypothetical protein